MPGISDPMDMPEDDTAFVHSFINGGRLIPAGEYYCPDGVTFPGDYIERARAAGREPDARDGVGFMLSQGPGYARINMVSGAFGILCGYATPND
jgi:hypothetical protein